MIHQEITLRSSLQNLLVGILVFLEFFLQVHWKWFLLHLPPSCVFGGSIQMVSSISSYRRENPDDFGALPDPTRCGLKAPQNPKEFEQENQQTITEKRLLKHRPDEIAHQLYWIWGWFVVAKVGDEPSNFLQLMAFRLHYWSIWPIFVRKQTPWFHIPKTALKGMNLPNSRVIYSPMLLAGNSWWGVSIQMVTLPRPGTLFHRAGPTKWFLGPFFEYRSLQETSRNRDWWWIDLI